jgi:hypothetical protein
MCKKGPGVETANWQVGQREKRTLYQNSVCISYVRVGGKTYIKS